MCGQLAKDASLNPGTGEPAKGRPLGEAGCKLIYPATYKAYKSLYCQIRKLIGKMDVKEREKMIRNYIKGYNNFDVNKMVADFSDEVVFENIQDNQITLSLSGLQAFLKQAEQAKSFFKERKQVIRSIQHSADSTEIRIDYDAILAIDLPNGLKKGQELKLSGKSVFVFRNRQIVKLTDIS